MRTCGSKVWPSLRPAPKITPKVKGTASEKQVYDRCHLAWRAGIVSDWYFGKRSPSDPTVVWSLNGHEYPKGEHGQVAAELERLFGQYHVASLAWGERWCGFLAVEVTYTDGSRAVERYDGQRKVLETYERGAA